MTMTGVLSVPSAKAPFEKTTIERSELRPHDILIDIKFSGICHSDIHSAFDEWGCGECEYCLSGEEQYCTKGVVSTYNALDYDGNPTYGGYSQNIVVTERFVVRIPDNLQMDVASPLLCAGITTYSPLKHWKVGPR
jgi:uncharacterized zinc-type alcohol dehydrogenase-like protein